MTCSTSCLVGGRSFCTFSTAGYLSRRAWKLAGPPCVPAGTLPQVAPAPREGVPPLVPPLGEVKVERLVLPCCGPGPLPRAGCSLEVAPCPFSPVSNWILEGLLPVASPANSWIFGGREHAGAVGPRLTTCLFSPVSNWISEEVLSAASPVNDWIFSAQEHAGAAVMASWMPTAANVLPAGGLVSGTCQPAWLCTRRIPAKSTISLKDRRKSAPTIGKATAASRNRHVKSRPATRMVRVQAPQHAIGFSSADTRRGPEGGEDEE